MIVSFIEGRVRLRHAALKNTETLQEVVSVLEGHEGVRKITGNARTGSLLVEYDPEKISQETLAITSAALEAQLGAAADGEAMAAVSSTEGEPRHAACAWMDDLNHHLPQGWPRLSNESAGLLLGLVVCVASGFLGGRRWHAWAGMTFAGMALQHLSKRV